jgi:hypothetical protein
MGKMKDDLENMENERIESLEARKEWLDDHGFKEEDVLVSEEGEYVVEYMEMDEGENGDYEPYRRFLPKF